MNEVHDTSITSKWSTTKVLYFFIYIFVICKYQFDARNYVILWALCCINYRGYSKVFPILSKFFEVYLNFIILIIDKIFSMLILYKVERNLFVGNILLYFINIVQLIFISYTCQQYFLQKVIVSL